MKLLGYLSIFFIIGWAGCQYTSIGVRKYTNGTKKDFEKLFYEVFGNVNYIELYDISQLFNKILLNSYLTLSQIRLSGITLDKKHLNLSLINQEKFLDIASPNGDLNLNWKANLSAKWSFRVGFSTIQEGTFTAELEAENTSFSFKFFTNYSESTAQMNNQWKINKSDIKGYGLYKGMHEGLKDMVHNNLSLKIDEELGKYGRILLDLMTYGRSFRRIPIKAKYKGQEVNDFVPNEFVLVNEISGLMRPVDSTPLNIKFNSFMMDEMTHRREIINTPITTSSYLSEADLLFYLPYNISRKIFNYFLVSSYETLFIKTDKAEKLFKQDFTIRTLAKFYPKLAEEHTMDKKLELGCTISSADLNAVNYTCAFFSTESENNTVFLIDTLMWRKQLKVDVDLNAHEKPIVISSEAKNFDRIVIKGIKIEERATRQLMYFFKPLSDYLVDITTIYVYPVSSKDNLEVIKPKHDAQRNLMVPYNVSKASL